jgi:hypothetical protein
VSKIFAFLTKKQHRQKQATIDRYEYNHVAVMCSSAPAPVVYPRNNLVRWDECNRESDSIDFDVVTQLVFPDRTACVARGNTGGAGGPGDRRSIAAYGRPDQVPTW